MSSDQPNRILLKAGRPASNAAAPAVRGYRWPSLLWGVLGLLLVAACGVSSDERAAGWGVNESDSSTEPAAAQAGVQPTAQARGLARLAQIKMAQSSAGEPYQPWLEDGHVAAANPAQRVDVAFEQAGVTLRRTGSAGAEDALVTLRWSGLGRGENVEPLPAESEPTIGDDGSVQYVREGTRTGGGVSHTEWFVNGPLGLEQGFELAAAPAGAGGPLVVEVAFSGLSPQLAAGGQAVSLVDVSGKTAMRYTDLFALDATGTQLPSRMAVVDGRVQLQIEDAGASYPLHIDPLLWAQDGKLGAWMQFDNDGEHFGSAVSVSGDTVVVGVPDDSDVTTQAGSAWVFRRVTTVWTLEKVLTAPDALAGDHFGASVGIDGDTVVVAAPDRDEAGVDSGKVYVFARSGNQWSAVTTLVPGDGAAGDRFGASIAFQGGSAVVGAPEDDDAGAASGSAYVFVDNGGVWTEEAKLTANDAAAGDHFGWSVAVVADSAMVGAPDDADAGAASGSAYRFVRSGGMWAFDTKFVAPDAAAGDHFGWSVSLLADRAFVGAPEHDATGVDSGAAYVFVFNGVNWPQEQRIDGGGAGDLFGYAVSAAGTYLAIGAPGDATGSVYGRTNFTWGLRGTFSALTAGGRCGHAVAATPDRVALGAPLEHRVGTESGTVRMLVRTGSDWNADVLFYVDTPTSSSAFGTAVALSGDYAAVGTYMSPGYVLVFRRVGAQWEYMARLSESVHSSIRYGSTVSLDGDTLLVGAPKGSTSSSTPSLRRAYVYRRVGTSWTLEATLNRSVSSSIFDEYGSSVALDADRALVGATGLNLVDVFVRNGTSWSLEQTISFGKPIGEAVALDGDTMVLGAPTESLGFAVNGTAYVYVRSGSIWMQQAQLFSSDAANFDQFGTSVALSGNRVVVGAPYADISGQSDAGAAYVFARTGTVWSEEWKLSASDAVAFDNFGRSVGIMGDLAVVGAPGRDVPASGAGALYMFLRAGAFWNEDAIRVASDAPPLALGRSMALGQDLVLAGAPSYSHPFWNGYQGAAYLFSSGQPGTACGSDAACDSGFCVDGVCCDSACGGGADDCQACSAALTGGIDGACGLMPAGGECRASSGSCDVAEQCDGVSAACPADVLVPAATVCRAAVGSCDVAEQCDGISGGCPADVVVAANTVCRASAGSCDFVEVCTGIAGTCPADVVVAPGTECRASQGLCDVAEACDGVTGACPVDGKFNSGVVCRAALGGCDVAETCDGVGNGCPADMIEPAGATCRVAAGLCDIAEQCDGASPVCPADAKALPGAVCRASAGGCDVTEHCNGVADSCPPDILVAAGLECRPAAGDCDVAEACDGATPACPQDAKAPAGSECRALAGVCDVAEQCDGVADSCPSDAKIAAGTDCRPAAGECDSAEQCNGTANACPVDVKQGPNVECRASAGDCDVAEHCDGQADACPADQLVAAGVECRAASGVCDVAEACNGNSGSCPSDAAAANGSLCDDGDACTTADSCMSGVCAGQDSCGTGGSGSGNGGNGGNAPEPNDDGGAPAANSGCGCRMVASPAPPRQSAWWALLLLTPWLRRRRRVGVAAAARACDQEAA